MFFFWEMVNCDLGSQFWDYGSPPIESGRAQGCFCLERWPSGISHANSGTLEALWPHLDVLKAVFFLPEPWPPDFSKPLTSDYVAQGCFFPQKNGPHIFGATWVCLTWVCDPPFDKNRGHRPTVGSLSWVCDIHVRQGVHR